MSIQNESSSSFGLSTKIGIFMYYLEMSAWLILLAIMIINSIINLIQSFNSIFTFDYTLFLPIFFYSFIFSISVVGTKSMNAFVSKKIIKQAYYVRDSYLVQSYGFYLSLCAIFIAYMESLNIQQATYFIGLYLIYKLILFCLLTPKVLLNSCKRIYGFLQPIS